MDRAQWDAEMDVLDDLSSEYLYHRNPDVRRAFMDRVKDLLRAEPPR